MKFILDSSDTNKNNTRFDSILWTSLHRCKSGPTYICQLPVTTASLQLNWNCWVLKSKITTWRLEGNEARNDNRCARAQLSVMKANVTATTDTVSVISGSHAYIASVLLVAPRNRTHSFRSTHHPAARWHNQLPIGSWTQDQLTERVSYKLQDIYETDVTNILSRAGLGVTVTDEAPVTHRPSLADWLLQKVGMLTILKIIATGNLTKNN